MNLLSLLLAVMGALFLATCQSSAALQDDLPHALITSPLPPVYSPDNTNETYKNPIIFADYSDPDVCRGPAGDDFYMTASSFSCFPGLPVLHSRDLVHWTIIGHAVDHYPFEGFTTPQHGKGIWAPSIRYHAGYFWIFVGDPDNGILMTKSRNPAGPWEKLATVKAAKGWIDCCPFWDDDGHAYLVHAFARSRAGFNNALDICRMSTDGTHLLDEGTRVYDGGTDRAHSNQTYTTVEGPKLYKRDGYYYIFAPGGGVAGGYQIVFRSKNILGPYDSRIVLEQGNTPINGPHQGGWVQTTSGQDWFIHFQDRGAYGRVTHLQPLAWHDDWPVIGNDPSGSGKGVPVLSDPMPDTAGSRFNGQNSKIRLAPQTSDEFDRGTLGLQWQWFADWQPRWYSLAERPGYLRLFVVSTPISVPLYERANLLLQKFPAEQFQFTTLLDPAALEPNESAGLVIVGRSTASLTVRRVSAGLRIARTQFQASANAPQPPDVDQESVPLPAAPVYLRARVSPGAKCIFSYSPDGATFTDLGQPFSATQDQWIGAKIGLFCNAPPPTPNPPATLSPPRSGHADFDFVHVEPF